MQVSMSICLYQSHFNLIHDFMLLYLFLFSLFFIYLLIYFVLVCFERGPQGSLDMSRGNYHSKL